MNDIKLPSNTKVASTKKKAVKPEAAPAVNGKSKANKLNSAAQKETTAIKKSAKKNTTVKKQANIKTKPTSASKQKKDQSTVVEKEVILQIRFSTVYGQNIFITGNHEVFGNDDIAQAKPLQYFDHETWFISIKLNPQKLPTSGIRYNYIVQNVDGSKTYDAGSDKVISKDLLTEKQLIVLDSWNHAGYIENAYYTEAFSKVLLRHHITKLSLTTPKKYSHIFRVKTPLLRQGETVCLLGNTAETGNWIEDKAVLMSRKNNQDFFEVRLDFTDISFPLYYKYGVYNVEQQRFIRFEEGDNRVLFDVFAKEKQTLINDGFLRIPTGYWKGAGVAIPVFSLRSTDGLGIGEFNDIKRFADWAKHTGLQLLQLLPVNDSTATHSWLDSYPYAAISAFAFHPMYLHVDDLIKESGVDIGFDLEAEKTTLNALPVVDYELVNDLKWKIIRQIYPALKDKVFTDEAFKTYFESNKHWLIPYALFCYLRDTYKTVEFDKWPDHNQYDAAKAKSLLKGESVDEIAIHFFTQYQLHQQFKEASAYAHSCGIAIKGDIPIGVYRYGSDTWQNPELYHMDTQAGAPPDDFAVKGQNWGFPTYNWQKMQQDGFAWWRQRFEQMSNYFDAFRIDHILGFFRIWSIPVHAVEGILGHFEPCIPVHENEFYERGIWFDKNRYCRPFITAQILSDMLGDQQQFVIDTFLNETGFESYQLKPEYATQKQVEAYFKSMEENEHNDFLKQSLYDLISNVILFETEDGNENHYHFRFSMQDTSSFSNIASETQAQLRELYVNYFFRRQDEFWKQQALQKLPALKHATDMLICGEDLGLVPGCVPEVMEQLGMLSLEIQRMPKGGSKEFFHPTDAPYMSVVTPSTHDMSTIRGWWEEDQIKTQRFYNEEMGQWGDAPMYCEDWINKAIVVQHFYSPAMWSIFQLQDLLGMHADIRRENPHEERINVPSNPKNYWQYRMHLTMDELMMKVDFNKEITAFVRATGRGVF